jgi:hypothetical protein
MASPIPLHAGIEAHTFCGKSPFEAHLKVDQGITARYNFVEPGLPISPPPRRPGFPIARVPVLCDDFLMYDTRPS